MRGAFVTVAMAGDFGKPRPALVIQADQYDQTATVTILLVSSSLVDAPLIRIAVSPNATNGLQKMSDIMVDKAMTVKRERLGPVFGQIEPETLVVVERCLAVFLGIAK